MFRKIFVRIPSTIKWHQEISLKPTEQKVLNLLVGGKTNKEIAALLGYTERTIKGHISNLFLKTGQSARSGLCGYAVARGLIC